MRARLFLSTRACFTWVDFKRYSIWYNSRFAESLSIICGVRACISVWATVFDRGTHRYNLSTVRHTRNCRWFTTADVFRHYYCDFVFCCRCRCSCSPPNVWKYLWLIDLLNGWKRIYEILINVLNECARDMWWRQKRLSSLKVIEMPTATATFPTTVTLHTCNFWRNLCVRARLAATRINHNFSTLICQHLNFYLKKML